MGAVALHTSICLDIYEVGDQKSTMIQLIEGISAGFPSPAADFIDLSIDLSKEIIHNPSTTFFGRVKGDSMIGAGISEGSLLVIDKSRKHKQNDIAICFVDGEFTVKRINFDKKICWLIAANDKYPPIKVTEHNNVMIWGVVTHAINYF